MIRRLHFEEVQPPPHALNPAGEIADSKDDQERQSLALEFKELLAKVGGGAPSLVDESTALSFALAQAMPAERVVHQELQKADPNQHDHDDEQLDVVDDEGADTGNQPVTIEDSDSDTGVTTAESEVEDESDRDINEAQALVSQTGWTTQQEEASLGTITSTATRVVQADGSQEQSLQFDNRIEDGSVTSKQSLDTDFDSQIIEVADGKAQETSGFQAQIQVDTVVESRIQVVDHKHGEDESDEGFEISASAVDLNSVDVSDPRRNRLDGATLREQESQPDLEQQTFSQTPTQGGLSEVDRPHETTSGREQFREIVADAVPNRATEAGHKTGQRGESDEALAGPEVISTPVSKGPVMRPEHSVQMTLLRQAFESLKHARQESSEAAPKIASSPIGGAAATSQARRSEGDVTTRGQRGLSRSQVTRMLERVESSLKEAARARDGKTISLRLDPANLGRVKVDVSLRDGGLHARITPENQQVMTALRDNAHELQGALRKLGLNVDTVSVTVSGEATPDEAPSGGQMENGSSFRQEGHNMPEERAQAPDFRIGNELAEWRRAGAPEETKAVDDHWVA